MTCILVEDQPPARRILRQFIADVGHLELAAEFGDALGAMAWLRDHRTELLFLDVHLPKLSGLDFLKSLPDPPPVILTTAFPDFALESYEFNVVDYLLKPFSFARFVRAVERVPALPRNAPPPSELFIKSGYEHVRVAVRDLTHIRAARDYTELHLSGRKLLSSEPLHHWLDTLDAQRFVQIHRSYLLNLDHLQRLNRTQVHLIDGTTLPIGRAYRTALMERLP